MKKITNEISSSAKKSLLTRAITAVVLVIIGVPCLILGGWFFFGLSMLIALLSSYEIVRASNLRGLLKILVYFITIVFAIGIIYYCLYPSTLNPDFKLAQNQYILYNSFGKEINLSIMLITLMLCVYFLISFSCEPFNIAYVFYFATMILVIAIGVQSFLFLRYTPFICFANEQSGATLGSSASSIVAMSSINKPGFKYFQSTFLLIYVLLGVTFNDMGAYFIGMLFGKHKMNERISPKKTWEGFIGGVVLSIIVSTLFALICALVNKPILPIFDRKHLYYVIIISMLMPLIADIGDFVFSSVKRTFGVKDFSNILPGHGGILDRIDSLIFAAALVSCLIIFIYIVGENPLNAMQL